MSLKKKEQEKITFGESILNVLDKGVPKEQEQEAEKYFDLFANEMKEIVKRRLLVSDTTEEDRGRLRLSSIGQPCERKLWYEINRPEYAEPLRPETKLKYLYGDLIESIILLLLRLSGHAVSSTQAEVELLGVKGHIDAVVDDTLVDVKSAATFSLQKFREGINEHNDPFGYLTQLYAYATALDKSKAAFIAVDKQHGNIVVDTHELTEGDKRNIKAKIAYRKRIVNLPEPPLRPFQDEPDGKSGNRKLGTTCSYCAFKKYCWPGLRMFLYGNGPRFLTKVEREPNVPECKF